MWWPEHEHWHVGLSAGSLVCVRRGGIGSRRLRGQDRVALVQPSGSPAWEPGVAALRLLLESRKLTARPVVHVVLSGRFARWELLPWNPAIGPGAEFAAFARARFEQAFGPPTGTWTLQHASPVPGSGTPACAIDTALLDALRSVCRDAGARLQSVAPYFSVACTHWRGRLRGRAGWLGVVDDDAMVLAAWQDGAWRGLHARRAWPASWEALPGMMVQLGQHAGLADPGAPLYLVATHRPDPVPLPSVPVWLDPRPEMAGAGAGSRMACGL